jgi:EAL domain-containing protein (putative c-di-GMP-specific phosphodiesterase class I)
MNTPIVAPTIACWSLSGQLNEHEPVRELQIELDRVTVGRKQSCNLLLTSSSVSGVHAELTIEGDELYVTDLDSTNGTFLNGVRITGRSQVKHGDLVQFAQVVFRARMEEQPYSIQTLLNDSTDRALALIQFDKLVSNRAFWPHFQPIVDLTNRKTIGYELLGRSQLFGLGNPQAMFTAAAMLDMEAELSRLLRFQGTSKADRLPGDPILFVNTHPAELNERGRLESSLRELRDASPRRKIVLEIHEAAVTELDQMRTLRSLLNDLDMGLAYDDFGSGQARLVELAEVPPDYLKFDICLIRDIHLASAERQRMLKSLVGMVNDLGTATLAEGVETAEEDDVCQQLGFALGQGFYYGKPAVAKSFAPSGNSKQPSSADH